METTYLRFERPDGSIFNKLTSISREQIEAYKQAGCKQLGHASTPEPSPVPVPADKPAAKKQPVKKG
ncbi:MAG: hypothetical protein IIA59_12145 [Candidatus Marinimicrobia bacterium]|nr:hypothetical protein [Candidatus Neomarinimicrobiota bacterium]